MTHSVRTSRRARWLIVLVALATALSTVGSIALASDVPLVDPGLDGTYDTGDTFEVQTPDELGPYTIGATATVGAAGGGGGDDANIQCIWDLVDMNRPFLGDSQFDRDPLAAVDPRPYPDAGQDFQAASWFQNPPDSVKVGQLDEYYMDYAWRDPLLNPLVTDPFWYDDVREDIAGGVPVPVFPCVASNPGVPGDGAEYTDFAGNVIQVYANTGDAVHPGPDGVYGTADDWNNNNSGDVTDAGYSWPGNPIGERVIELWAAVDGPGQNVGEIQQVYWDVYHPDGTKKVQVHDFIGIGQAECANGYNNILGAGASDPFDPASFALASENTVFGAAIGTAQMDLDAAHGILDQCAQNRKKLYWDHFTLSKHQPCGPYQVNAHAVATSGLETMLTNFISVLCFVHLDLDFDTVDYPGPLQPTDATIVDGDTVMAVGDGRPTAINVGSGGLTVGVDFSKLTNDQNKHITTFDLQFGVNPFGGLETATDPNGGGVDGDPTTIEVDTVGTKVRADLPLTAATTLCANETGKFVFSIHTEAASQGTYVGTIDIVGIPAPQTCLNDFGVWGGYHVLTDAIAEGGGAAFEPVDLPTFDDDYGRNQRSVVNP